MKSRKQKCIKLRVAFVLIFQDSGSDEMDVDAAPTTQPLAKHVLPEMEIYCYFFVLLFLIDKKNYDLVMYYSFFIWSYCSELVELIGVSNLLY